MVVYCNFFFNYNQIKYFRKKFLIPRTNFKRIPCKRKKDFYLKNIVTIKCMYLFICKKNNMNMHRKSTLKYLCELVQYI